MTKYQWKAGIWEQEDGFVAWSQHSCEDLALRAAKWYARAGPIPTGGVLTSAGGVKDPEGNVRWYTWDGKEIAA